MSSSAQAVVDQKPSMDGHNAFFTDRIKGMVTAISLFMPWIIIAGLVLGPAAFPFVDRYYQAKFNFERLQERVQALEDHRDRFFPRQRKP